MPTKVTKAKAKPRAKKAVAKRTVKAAIKQEHANVECNDCKFYNKPLNVDSYLWVLFVGILVCAFTYFNDVYLNTKLTAEEISQATVEGIDKYSQVQEEKAAEAQRAAAVAARKAKEPVYTSKDITDNDAVLGNADAPVTLVEFSDFQCPFCKRFYDGAYKEIKEKYVKTGKVKIIFRDYPLSIHPGAYPAAHAAECVREQAGDEAYFKMHDKFFDDRDIFTGDLGANITAAVEELGYDSEAFTACMESNKFADEISADFKEGSEVGVKGTPAVFVNGLLVEGAQPFANFETVIEAALKANENK